MYFALPEDKTKGKINRDGDAGFEIFISIEFLSSKDAEDKTKGKINKNGDLIVLYCILQC